MAYSINISPSKLVHQCDIWQGEWHRSAPKETQTFVFFFFLWVSLKFANKWRNYQESWVAAHSSDDVDCIAHFCTSFSSSFPLTSFSQTSYFCPDLPRVSLFQNLVNQRQGSIQAHLSFDASKDQACQMAALSLDESLVMTLAVLFLAKMSHRLLLSLQNSWQQFHCLRSNYDLFIMCGQQKLHPVGRFALVYA